MTVGKDSAIQWTKHSYNPWVGCFKVSAGCAQCYMYREQKRYGNDPKEIRVTKPATFNAPLKWARTDPGLVFVSSWTDFFLEEVNQEDRDKAWDIIRTTPQNTYQILTKRPENIKDMLPDDWGHGWPHVWLGVSVENQEMADLRIPWLLQVPARLHFLSCEPLLGPVVLSPYLGYDTQNGESGYGERRSVVRTGEDGGVENRSLGPDLEAEKGRLDTGGTQNRLRLFANAQNDSGDQNTHGGSSTSLGTFYGEDPGRTDNQSQKRDQGRQSPRELGGGNALGKHETCFQDRVEGSTRSDKSGSEANRQASAGNKRDLCKGGYKPAKVGGKIRGGLSDGIEDSSRRTEDAPEGKNVRLHKSAQAQEREKEQQGTILFVIVGGESGPDARPMDPQWAIGLKDECGLEGIPFFMKQMGGWPNTRHNLEDMPPDLRIREFPT